MLRNARKATIAEYGVITDGAAAIQAEIHTRGPVACSVNAHPLHEYTGGIYNNNSDALKIHNHVVSIVGWGLNEVDQSQYWVVRDKLPPPTSLDESY